MKNFKGTFTALATPFKDDKVDYKSLDRLLKQQLAGGVNGFVVNGTTGESPTLTSSEIQELFKHIRGVVGNQVALIVGTGSNSTAKTIEDSQKAEQWGADALLVVVPYYNKPPQRGLVEHFKAVAASVKIPTILYNVPSRTVTSLATESILELSRAQGIVGIKEASGKIDFDAEISHVCGPEFVLLSGDDGTYVEFLGVGGHGVISVVSHIIPKQMVQWKKWVDAGQIAEARADIQKYTKLIDLIFVEANPIGIKKALQLMGIFDSATLRLPLAELTPQHTENLKNEMHKLGLL